MIQNPALLAAVFVALVAGVTAAKSTVFFRPAFRFLPVPFWCYFLPMCLATAGVFPVESPLFGFLSKFLLPVCLAFLLINVDLPALAGLGRPALLAMGVGMGGIVAGALASYAIFRPWMPPESWKIVGALAGSWTGGSANMLAVKEALSAPETVFAPAVVVDTVVAYGWMALLVSLVGRQAAFDRWNRVDPRWLEFFGDARVASTTKKMLPWPGVAAVCLGLGLFSSWAARSGGAAASNAVARFAPSFSQTLTASTWMVLCVTTLGLALSLTGRFGARPVLTEKTGTFLLYVLLASLGARAQLTAIFRTPVFLALAAVWMAIHGVLLLAGGRLLRSPLFLLVTASQACVGGVVSAPMVSAVYRPELSAVGLLLAVTGNVVGTYVGLATAQMCHWMGGH